MKLAIDSHTLEQGEWAGKEQYLMSLLVALKERSGVELFVYSRRPLNLEPSLGLAVTFVSKRLPKPLWQLWLLRDLRRQKIDHFFVPCTYLAAALNIFVPQTIVIHDLSSLLPKVRQTHTRVLRLKERLTLALALANSRHIIAISEHTKEDIGRYFPAARQKIKVIYQGCRFGVLRAEQVDREKKPLVLAVGTIEPRKNLAALITAFEDLKRLEPATAWRLVVIGKVGWKAAPILDLMSKSPFADDIEITGYIDDSSLRAYYQEAACLVYPSNYEGFGLPVVEAMANGCPVIAASHSSLPEVMGQAGIYFHKLADISVLVRKLRTDRIWRDQVIDRGLAQARAFSWEQAAQSIKTLIQS